MHEVHSLFRNCQMSSSDNNNKNNDEIIFKIRKKAIRSQPTQRINNVLIWQKVQQLYNE